MKEKFTFDRTSMVFRKTTRSVWGLLGKGLKYFLVTASLATVYYAGFSLVISTDSEKALRRENRMYRQMFEEISSREQLLGDVISDLRIKDNGIYRRIFNTDAPELGDFFGNASLLSSVDSIPDKEIVDYTSRKLGTLERSASRIEENFLAVWKLCSSADSIKPPLSIPLANFSYAKTGASVGDKVNPFFKVSVPHGGLDLVSPKGVAVLCAAPGVVTAVIHSRKGLGNVVEISHEGGYVTRYAHLENTRVTRGQKVALGAQIGQVGVSGNSFAPHLHYEILKDSLRLDPVNHFFGSVTPDEYIGMIFMSANTGQSMD